MNFLFGKEKNKIRSILRKALKQGQIEYRKTYHDYYDSCHPPVETPNAEFIKLDPNSYEYRTMLPRDFKAGGPMITVSGNNTFKFSTGYSTYEVRINNFNEKFEKLVLK